MSHYIGYVSHYIPIVYPLKMFGGSLPAFRSREQTLESEAKNIMSSWIFARGRPQGRAGFIQKHLHVLLPTSQLFIGKPAQEVTIIPGRFTMILSIKKITLLLPFDSYLFWGVGMSYF